MAPNLPCHSCRWHAQWCPYRAIDINNQVFPSSLRGTRIYGIWNRLVPRFYFKYWPKRRAAVLGYSNELLILRSFRTLLVVWSLGKLYQSASLIYHFGRLIESYSTGGSVRILRISFAGERATTEEPNKAHMGLLL